MFQVQSPNFKIFIIISGLEHQLGDEAHDDPVRGREERRLQLSVRRLQGSFLYRFY